jgi:hypothetical protein
VTAHELAPLLVCGVHVLVAVIALVRGASRRTHQLVAAVALALAVWSFGVFAIRRAPDVAAGLAGQRLLHAAFSVLPAVYHHLVRVVTGDAAARRRAVWIVYGVAAGFVLVALIPLPLLVRGVVRTPRGWAPLTGVLALPLFVFYLATLAATLRPLRAVRLTPMVVASSLLLLAPLANFIGALLQRLQLTTLELPPLLLPAGLVAIALVWFATREMQS